MLTIHSQSDKKSVIKVSGSSQIVSEGRVDPLALHSLHRSQFRFGLGVGTFTGIENIGEAIVIESKPYISWMQGDELQTETGEHFFSPFMVGIDSKQHIGAFMHYKSSAPISLHALYDKLSKQYPEGFAIVGYAKGAELCGTYFKKPPIYQENVITNHSKYWAKEAHQKGQNVCFVGIVLPPEAKKHTSKELQEKLFYKHPEDEEVAPFQSHTNAALLDSGSYVMPKEIHTFFEFLKNSSVLGVRHMFSSSILQEGAFALYPIESIKIVEKPLQEGPKMGRETVRFPFPDETGPREHQKKF